MNDVVRKTAILMCPVGGFLKIKPIPCPCPCGKTMESVVNFGDRWEFSGVQIGDASGEIEILDGETEGNSTTWTPIL